MKESKIIFIILYFFSEEDKIFEIAKKEIHTRVKLTQK